MATTSMAVAVHPQPSPVVIVVGALPASLSFLFYSIGTDGYLMQTTIECVPYVGHVDAYELHRGCSSYEHIWTPS